MVGCLRTVLHVCLPWYVVTGLFEYHVIGPHIMVLDDRLYEDHAMGLLVVACHDQSFEDHAIGLLTICMRIML